MPHVRSLTSRRRRQARACHLRWVRQAPPVPLPLASLLAHDNVVLDLPTESADQVDELLAALTNPCDGTPESNSRSNCSSAEAACEAPRLVHGSRWFKGGSRVAKLCVRTGIAAVSFHDDQNEQMEVRNRVDIGMQTEDHNHVIAKLCVRDQNEQMEVHNHADIGTQTDDHNHVGIDKNAGIPGDQKGVKGTSTLSLTTTVEVKTWIDDVGSINELNAIQYLKTGMDLFAELMTEGGFPSKQARQRYVTLTHAMLERVQGSLKDLLEFFEEQRYLTGQMSRADFLLAIPNTDYRIQIFGRPRNDAGKSELKGTSSDGKIARKGKGKGKGKGANIAGQEFDEVCRFGRPLTDFERMCGIEP